MKVVCAWCGKPLRETKGPGISHGICKECADNLRQKIKGSDGESTEKTRDKADEKGYDQGGGRQ